MKSQINMIILHHVKDEKYKNKPTKRVESVDHVFFYHLNPTQFYKICKLIRRQPTPHQSSNGDIYESVGFELEDLKIHFYT